MQLNTPAPIAAVAQVYQLPWAWAAWWEHWFNRRCQRTARRDIYLRHDSFDWHVRVRHGGADGCEVTHTFTTEDDARAMIERLKARIAPEESDWALMPSRRA